jgi:hypothetical protein
MPDKRRADDRSAGESDKVVVLDTRWIYGLFGVVALTAVAALGVLLGRHGAPTPVATTQGAGAAAAAAATTPAPLAPANVQRVGGNQQPIADVTLNVPTTVDGAPILKPVFHGRCPVRPDEAPVGPNEGRIWFTDLASKNCELDLGDISATKPVTRQVMIENIGTANLTLIDSGGSCGCTTVMLQAQDLAPAAKTFLQVKYDPRVSDDAGKQIRKQVYVRSNDQLTPIAEFYITANVAAK